MATRVVETVVDDIDGTVLSSALAETVSVGIDGEQYSLDLSPRNARRLREALEPFVAAAERTTQERTRGAYRVTQLTRAVPNEVVRRWARSNGIDLPKRGAVPKHVRDQYDAAH